MGPTRALALPLREDVESEDAIDALAAAAEAQGWLARRVDGAPLALVLVRRVAVPNAAWNEFATAEDAVARAVGLADAMGGPAATPATASAARRPAPSRPAAGAGGAGSASASAVTPPHPADLPWPVAIRTDVEAAALRLAERGTEEEARRARQTV